MAVRKEGEGSAEEKLWMRNPHLSGYGGQVRDISQKKLEGSELERLRLTKEVMTSRGGLVSGRR